MKRFLYLLFITIVLVGCQTKEEKAAELIRNELSKTLYDYESYSPIETIVTEAKLTEYNDTICWKQANILLYAFKQATESLDEVKNAKEHMEIWGAPTYYSSTYSDNQYYKYKKEWTSKMEIAKSNWELVKRLSANLKDSIQALDKNKIVGWEVKHRFRCKTKGGSATIGDYRYVIDKNMKKVLIYEDVDEDDYKQIRELVQAAMDGTFESSDE